MAIVDFEADGAIAIVTLNRPEARNAVDGPTAKALAAGLPRFDSDAGPEAACRAVRRRRHISAPAPTSRRWPAASAATADANPLDGDGHRPDGPVAAAALQAGDRRRQRLCGRRRHGTGAVVRPAGDEEDATFGVFCRRWGVPLIDGGTVRLPRLIGMSRALDLILTGRAVGAQEAYAIGLANRVVDKGATLGAAIELARQITSFPRGAMRGDRMSAYEQWGLSLPEALANEYEHGIAVIRSGETREGAARFAEGVGRGGRF